MERQAILIIEDIMRYAVWQTEAMRKVFPDKEIIHVRNLKDAQKALSNTHINVQAILTDNGYPLVPGGERVGSKSIEGGAGTLLIKQIRSGRFGEDYQNTPISWHTATMDDRKVNRVLSYDEAESKGMTMCFEKEDGPHYYQEMGEYLRDKIVH